MNRNLTLILLIVVVLALLGVWLYLLFAPAQENNAGPVEGSGEFTNFDEFGQDARDDFVIEPGTDDTQTEEEILAESQPDILRQLTSKNVVGYHELASDTKDTFVRYMEAGVGHIYSINLDTETESRVSATTIPDAREASFSPDGTFVVVKRGSSVGINPIYLARINELDGIATVSANPISETVSSFTVTDDNTVLYSVVGNSSVVVSEYDPETNLSEVVFSTPFREAQVLLGSNTTGPHYFYPRTSANFEGFMYQYVDGSLNRLPLDGFGFDGNADDTLVISSAREGNVINSTLYDTVTEMALSVQPVIPSKCAFYAEELYCGIESDLNYRYDSIDDWNKGIDVYADDLWRIGETPERLISIQRHSGRFVDVTNTTIAPGSGDWYFQSRLDDTLWVYELSRVNQ